MVHNVEGRMHLERKLFYDDPLLSHQAEYILGQDLLPPFAISSISTTNNLDLDMYICLGGLETTFTVSRSTFRMGRSG